MIYIAGPMTGIPQHNFPAFDAATKRFRERGFGVVNPAEMDRDKGIDNHTHLMPDQLAAMSRDFMRRDLNVILDKC